MSYPIQKSPLFGLSSIHLLARALQLNVGRLRDIEPLVVLYREGITHRDGRDRRTETPTKTLRRIHNRIQVLLSRIETPDYLHSGKKKRSYITNAAAHFGNAQLFEADISKFYQSATREQVYKCFCDIFGCCSDVAGILSRLLTYENHIPTGSPVSSLLSYFAYKPMFDELLQLSSLRGLTMTLLQDDLTFSGPAVTEEFRAEVRRIIRNYQLVPKRSKQRFFHGGKPAKVTGIVVTNDGLVAPWSRHRKLRSALDEFDTAQTEADIRTAYQRVMGRLSEIERVQGKLNNLKPRLRQEFQKRIAALQ